MKVKTANLFRECIDDGFGKMNGTKKDVHTWVKEFNNLRENIFISTINFGNHVAFMDL